MKLAEALQERADLNRRIMRLRSRMENNSLVQEDEEPAEDPGALMAEFDVCAARLEKLTAQINKTNCCTYVGESTLTELIARKDSLRLQAESYRKLVSIASQGIHRATRSEIKILSTINVRVVQKKVDMLSKELRLVDNTIQETNWNTELLED